MLHLGTVEPRGAKVSIDAGGPQNDQGKVGESQWKSWEDLEKVQLQSITCLNLKTITLEDLSLLFILFMLWHVGSKMF